MDAEDSHAGIVIVEDDPQIRELAEFAARKAGFGVIITAPDGQAALDRIDRISSSVRYAVLTDLAMPRLNGHALVEALKQNPVTAGVPVFMFSSSGAPEDRLVALEAGCRAYFDKPTSMESLVAIMREVHAAALQTGEARR